MAAAGGDDEDLTRELVRMGMRPRGEEAIMPVLVAFEFDSSEALEALERRRVYLAHYAPGLGDVSGEKLSRVLRYHMMTSDLIGRENDGGKK